MGRIGEVNTRTWQMAHRMKEVYGSRTPDGAGGLQTRNDNERVLRYLVFGNVRRGQIIDVADAKAQQLVKRGLFVPVQGGANNTGAEALLLSDIADVRVMMEIRVALGCEVVAPERRVHPRGVEPLRYGAERERAPGVGLDHLADPVPAGEPGLVVAPEVRAGHRLLRTVGQPLGPAALVAELPGRRDVADGGVDLLGRGVGAKEQVGRGGGTAPVRARPGFRQVRQLRLRLTLLDGGRPAEFPDKMADHPNNRVMVSTYRSISQVKTRLGMRRVLCEVCTTYTQLRQSVMRETKPESSC